MYKGSHLDQRIAFRRAIKGNVIASCRGPAQGPRSSREGRTKGLLVLIQSLWVNPKDATISSSPSSNLAEGIINSLRTLY